MIFIVSKLLKRISFYFFNALFLLKSIYFFACVCFNVKEIHITSFKSQAILD